MLQFLRTWLRNGLLSYNKSKSIPYNSRLIQPQRVETGCQPIFSLIKYSQPSIKLALPPLVYLLYVRSWEVGSEQVVPFWATSWTRHWNSAAQQPMRPAPFLLESAHHRVSCPGLHRALIHLVKLGKEPFPMSTKGDDLILRPTGQQTVGQKCHLDCPFQKTPGESERYSRIIYF